MTLTPKQALNRKIQNDARNIADYGRHNRTMEAGYHRVVTDCARRLFEARAIDRQLGCELERQAEANLRAALQLGGPLP